MDMTPANPLIADRDRFAARWPERAETVRGRRWGVTDMGGSGPVLLLLPGTLGRGDIFWRVAEPLHDRVRVIALTYPASFDLAQWAGDILVLLRRLGVARCTVLGSSLGGYLAQYLTAMAPETCTRLIAANTLADAGEVADKPPYVFDLARAPMAQLRAGFRGGLSQWAEVHPDQRDLVGLLLAEVAGRIPARHLRARLQALKHAPPLPAPGLHTAATFVIEAADDPLIPEPMRQAVRDRLRPARCFRFTSGGHFPYIARPGDYLRALEGCLGLTALDGTGPVQEL